MGGPNISGKDELPGRAEEVSEGIISRTFRPLAMDGHSDGVCVAGLGDLESSKIPGLRKICWQGGSTDDRERRNQARDNCFNGLISFLWFISSAGVAAHSTLYQGIFRSSQSNRPHDRNNCATDGKVSKLIHDK